MDRTHRRNGLARTVPGFVFQPRCEIAQRRKSKSGDHRALGFVGQLVDVPGLIAALEYQGRPRADVAFVSDLVE